MRLLVTALAGLALTSAAGAQTSVGVELTAPGPKGALAGTLIDPDPRAPLLVIIPGSGPTDRDGNNPMATKGGPLRQLAEALAARGLATLRVDKRGMFGSRAAIDDANAVTVADYAADAHAWAEVARKRTGRGCVWLLGHSEGGLVALQAAQDPRGLCGIVLVSAAGRPLGAVMREQFRANPANAPILKDALAMIDALEAGRSVDPATLPAPLPLVFPKSVHGYLGDLLRHDPAKLAAGLRLPLLVVQGDRDIQVAVIDAQALAKAASGATLSVIPGMTHALRIAKGEDYGASLATYRDAGQPVARELVDAVVRFVMAPR
jgi:uncharacterized protein